MLNILTFQKWLPFWSLDKLIYRKCYRSWICQQHIHNHFRHFYYYLIEAIAEILTKIWHFKVLVYFRTLWHHQWRHDMDWYMYSHNPMIHMYSKFNDDISVHFLVIMKNVLISFLFIKEYKTPLETTLWCHRFFFITMKNTFSSITWDDLFISEVKLNCV